MRKVKFLSNRPSQNSQIRSDDLHDINNEDIQNSKLTVDMNSKDGKGNDLILAQKDQSEEDKKWMCLQPKVMDCKAFNLNKVNRPIFGLISYSDLVPNALLQTAKVKTEQEIFLNNVN